MKAIIREWNDSEKKKMTEIAGKISDLLSKEIKDKIMIANILDMMRDTYYDTLGIITTRRQDKNGESATEFERRRLHVQKMLVGMTESNVGLLMFYPDDDVWMQYHMAKFLRIPLFILCKEEYKHEMAPRIVKGKNVIDIMYISSINEDVIEQFTKKAMDWAKENIEDWVKENRRFD